MVRDGMSLDNEPVLCGPCREARDLARPAPQRYFKPKNMGDVRLLLGGLEDDVAVTLTPGVQLPPTVLTVSDLRRRGASPFRSPIHGSCRDGEAVVVTYDSLSVDQARAHRQHRQGGDDLRCEKSLPAAHGRQRAGPRCGTRRA
jgi:hypothetical protein